MNNCKVCGSADIYDTGFVSHDDQRFKWFRCIVCGSDSSTAYYADVSARYKTEEYRDHIKNSGAADDNLDANVRWFSDYRPTLPGPDFLDVGLLDGRAMVKMQNAGFRCHGWDCNPNSYFGDHTTIGPVFLATLFPRQYDAVMCREVIEHVETWRHLLGELYRVTKPGGILQLQTPRPWFTQNPIGYQSAHLQLFSPLALEWECNRAGFALADKWIWDCGQALMLRK